MKCLFAMELSGRRDIVIKGIIRSAKELCDNAEVSSNKMWVAWGQAIMGIIFCVK